MTAACKSVGMSAAICAWASSEASDGMQGLKWREEDMALRAFEMANRLAIRKRRFGRSACHNDCSRAFGICLFLMWVVNLKWSLLATQLTCGEELFYGE